MIKKTQTKTGASMIELLLVISLLGAASFFAVAKHLSKTNFNNGTYDARKAEETLKDTLMLHPINSMIKPQLYDMTQDEKTHIDEIKLRKGFSEISQDELNESRDRFYKNGVTSEKHPVEVAASEQFFTLSTTLPSKEACAGFVSKIKTYGSWTSITVNGNNLKIGQSGASEIASLCSDDLKSYDVTLEFCQPTALLTCS